MIPYVPAKLVKPPKMIPAPTAWDEMELVIEDLLERFNVGRSIALEFGVFNGYSTVALSNYFDLMIGVDTFKGDEHSTHGEVDDFFERIVKNFEPFDNIAIIRDSYQNFIAPARSTRYDLIHIDIVHTFEDTYACGKWAAEHSDFLLLHDTIAFPEVRRAVETLANETGMTFYNYEKKHGLGILVRQ